ncbi:MAG: type II toxin-antitoxin system MqsA family antitoxin [Methylophilaceae bacterium]
MVYKLSRDGDSCPACGEGHLSSVEDSRLVEYKGVTESVAMHYSVCDLCESELTGHAESQANNRAINAFHKRVDSLLSGLEVRDHRKTYGISQALASELFGGGQVGFSRYEKDEVKQSLAMDNLIRLCFANPYNIILLAQMRDIELPEQLEKKIQDDYYRHISDIASDVQKCLDKELSKLVSSKEYECANDEYEDFGNGYGRELITIVNWKSA